LTYINEEGNTEEDFLCEDTFVQSSKIDLKCKEEINAEVDDFESDEDNPN
jgi:hypothetical protein